MAEAPVLLSAVVCQYKQCGQDTAGEDRTEVRTFEPEQTGLKETKALVNWHASGDATFHRRCWVELTEKCKRTEDGVSAEEIKMIKEAKKTAEYFDCDERVKSEAKRVSQMIMTSSHCIAFTGAGISTSAGIGDFRGKTGKWTEKDRAKATGKPTKGKGKRPKGNKGVIFENLRPTYTHEALCKLLQMGLLRYVISQNTDGLHRLSGIPRDSISELHGNSFHEKCEKCGARYERPYRVKSRMENVVPKKCKNCRINHRTGRKCERKGCDGYLMNTIINFGDDLEDEPMDRASEHAQKNDLVLCLGTSLTVSPANELVEEGKKPVRMLICNRQPTDFDPMCYKINSETKSQVGSRVFGDCDHLMREVMRCILPQDALQEWEDGREDRMKEYNKQREPVD
ncbi:NAD-dependent protein deacetylase sirtuin-6 [Lingula anatina]|uniref:protein acetyllysine N-acetyltransferase n=1 Tax=Lingula anatina TaxID=7574 RepID=A0A1S3IHX4_LINAN|nr:NAD-dependent protein deacetylase sirtuin-6 [Lingula anatina]XP_013397094.1 NAD-dependent protein deacetylase sirtuin-6 [Lingula anatina]|eukprot:XP_013397093.1 NAD-dependent protein deacetylase sirtuin-6 [Lingula anatina]